MRLLQLSCDLQTLNLALIYCHTNVNFVHINLLCLSQVIFQDFLLKDQFPVPVDPKHGQTTTCAAVSRLLCTGIRHDVVELAPPNRLYIIWQLINFSSLRTCFLRSPRRACVPSCLLPDMRPSLPAADTSRTT